MGDKVRSIFFRILGLFLILAGVYVIYTIIPCVNKTADLINYGSPLKAFGCTFVILFAAITGILIALMGFGIFQIDRDERLEKEANNEEE